MIDGTFSDAEVRVVLAHEIGHHSSNHIPKGLAWFALFALPGAWVLMRATRRRGGMGEAAAVPAGAPRRRRAPARSCAGAGVDQPPDGGRGRLEGAADDARSGGGPRPLRRLRRRRRSPTPTRRPGPTCSSTATRRWRSASRWRRRGSGGIRRRPDAWRQPGVECEGWSPPRPARRQAQAGDVPYVSVYSGPEPPSGGVRRPPRAVIAPHWTQLDGVSFSSTVPSPSSSPTS